MMKQLEMSVYFAAVSQTVLLLLLLLVDIGWAVMSVRPFVRQTELFCFVKIQCVSFNSPVSFMCLEIKATEVDIFSFKAFTSVALISG